MIKITGNEPANPINGYEGVIYSKGDPSQGHIENGGLYSSLTIRQQFAMAAMASLAPLHLIQRGPQVTAELAVDYADALINELNKPIL
jgi:hypothetical protein